MYIKQVLGAAALLAVLGTAMLGCRQETSRWEAADKATRGAQDAVSEQAVAGSVFNQFFPKQEGEYDLVFKQEKQGFAQASLQQDSKELAVLSVMDTRSNPAARDKYSNAAESIAGYPLVEAGERTHALLVADRFQVQIQSVDPAFGASSRRDWLVKFNLAGIAEIE